jgi:hypothetical protein
MDIINEKTVEMTFDEFCRGGKSITPGPWNVCRQNPSPTTGEWMIAGAKPGYLAEVRNCGSGDVEANARLIAAAPDLLDALNRVLPQYEALLKDCGLRSLGTADQARAAIAKAEGKT